jgi:hypothetical protein
MPTEARPNLFIVGAQKSGTSALAGWLGEHPNVCMSFPKEPGFLAFGENGYTYPDGYGNPAPASQYVVRDERAYLKLFAHASPAQRILGEASTWYFALGGMARRIKSYRPDAKIIVILRDPVERAYSAWCHARGDRLEPCGDFSTALQLESQRGDVEFLLRYQRMGLYSEALAEYQSVFSDAQLLVLFYDDLRADPLSSWRAVCAFLGIDASHTPVFEHRYNRSGQPRSRLVHSLLRSHRLKQVLRAVLPHTLAMRAKRQVEDLNLEQFPAMDDNSRVALREYYRADIQRLSRLTNRDLVAWLQ